jgi:hypothetical protein
MACARQIVEHKDRHEIMCSGRALLRTLNFYVPPGYSKDGGELPPARPERGNCGSRLALPRVLAFDMGYASRPKNI